MPVAHGQGQGRVRIQLLSMGTLVAGPVLRQGSVLSPHVRVGQTNLPVHVSRQTFDNWLEKMLLAASQDVIIRDKRRG